MQSDLSVLLAQWPAALDPAVNRQRLGELAADVDGADLVVLPEAFARDFGAPGSALGEHAESLDGRFATQVEALAEESAATVVAGMFEVSADSERPYNTLVARGRGEASAYRKIHLYDSFGFKESDQLRGGPVAPVVLDVAGWRVGLMTCYDLRFPELGRLLADAGAEVLVVPAAWVAGEHKLDHWRTLLRARAIENVAYVAAAAQPGPRYTGHSLVVDPDGRVVQEGGDGEQLVRATLSRATLAESRRRNPSLANRRIGGSGHPG